MAGEGRQETALGLGERLRSARKARAMTLEQAAQSLRLEAGVLRALEEDRFAEVGAPVFVRGHLKAYARLLGLTEDAVLGAYRSAVPDSDTPPKVTREREKPLSSGPGPVAIAALVLLVVIIIGFFWSLQGARPSVEAPAATSAAPAMAVRPAPVATAAPEAALDPGAQGGTDGGAGRDDTRPGTPAEPGPATTPAGEAAPAGSRLTLDFTESAWVEVRDRKGQLLSGEQPKGTRQELVGEPPFDVVLGNYPGVRLALDGTEVALPEIARSSGSRVARFRIPVPERVDPPDVQPGAATAPGGEG